MRESKLWLIVLTPILLLAIGAAGYGVWWKREEALIEQMTYEAANSAFQAGEFHSAFRAMHRMAAGGDIRAQLMLGWFYEEGYGTEIDDVQAFNWYLRAADGEHPTAMANVREFYRVGRGLTHRNPWNAARWAERLAVLGDPVSQTQLGAAYLAGSGVAKDLDRGLEWLQEAIESGHAPAMARLARGYKNGTFGDPDYESALRWYQSAVKFGDEWSMLDVVRMLNDESLPVFDLEQSYYWALVGSAWAREGSIIPGSLAREMVKTLYHVPEGIPSGTVNVSGFTGDGLSPDPSPLDYDYENWPRRLGPEAQRRVEADVESLLARWPDPPMTE